MASINNTTLSDEKDDQSISVNGIADILALVHDDPTGTPNPAAAETSIEWPEIKTDEDKDPQHDRADPLTSTKPTVSKQDLQQEIKFRKVRAFAKERSDSLNRLIAESASSIDQNSEPFSPHKPTVKEKSTAYIAAINRLMRNAAAGDENVSKELETLKLKWKQEGQSDRSEIPEFGWSNGSEISDVWHLSIPNIDESDTPVPTAAYHFSSNDTLYDLPDIPGVTDEKIDADGTELSRFGDSRDGPTRRVPSESSTLGDESFRWLATDSGPRSRIPSSLPSSTEPSNPWSFPSNTISRERSSLGLQSPSAGQPIASRSRGSTDTTSLRSSHRAHTDFNSDLRSGVRVHGPWLPETPPEHSQLGAQFVEFGPESIHDPNRNVASSFLNGGSVLDSERTISDNPFEREPSIVSQLSFDPLLRRAATQPSDPSTQLPLGIDISQIQEDKSVSFGSRKSDNPFASLGADPNLARERDLSFQDPNAPPSVGRTSAYTDDAPKWAEFTNMNPSVATQVEAVFNQMGLNMDDYPAVVFRAIQLFGGRDYKPLIVKRVIKRILAPSMQMTFNEAQNDMMGPVATSNDSVAPEDEVSVLMSQAASNTESQQLARVAELENMTIAQIKQMSHDVQMTPFEELSAMQLIEAKAAHIHNNQHIIDERIRLNRIMNEQFVNADHDLAMGYRQRRFFDNGSWISRTSPRMAGSSENSADLPPLPFDARDLRPPRLSELPPLPEDDEDDEEKMSQESRKSKSLKFFTPKSQMIKSPGSSLIHATPVVQSSSSSFRPRNRNIKRASVEMGLALANQSPVSAAPSSEFPESIDSAVARALNDESEQPLDKAFLKFAKKFVDKYPAPNMTVHTAELRDTYNDMIDGDGTKTFNDFERIFMRKFMPSSEQADSEIPPSIHSRSDSIPSGRFNDQDNPWADSENESTGSMVPLAEQTFSSIHSARRGESHRSGSSAAQSQPGSLAPQSTALELSRSRGRRPSPVAAASPITGRHPTSPQRSFINDDQKEREVGVTSATSGIFDDEGHTPISRGFQAPSLRAGSATNSQPNSVAFFNQRVALSDHSSDSFRTTHLIDDVAELGPNPETWVNKFKHPEIIPTPNNPVGLSPEALGSFAVNSMMDFFAPHRLVESINDALNHRNYSFENRGRLIEAARAFRESDQINQHYDNAHLPADQATFRAMSFDRYAHGLEQMDGVPNDFFMGLFSRAQAHLHKESAIADNIVQHWQDAVTNGRVNRHNEAGIRKILREIKAGLIRPHVGLGQLHHLFTPAARDGERPHTDLTHTSPKYVTSKGMINPPTKVISKPGHTVFNDVSAEDIKAIEAMMARGGMVLYEIDAGGRTWTTTVDKLTIGKSYLVQKSGGLNHIESFHNRVGKEHGGAIAGLLTSQEAIGGGWGDFINARLPTFTNNHPSGSMSTVVTAAPTISSTFGKDIAGVSYKPKLTPRLQRTLKVKQAYIRTKKGGNIHFSNTTYGLLAPHRDLLKHAPKEIGGALNALFNAHDEDRKLTVAEQSKVRKGLLHSTISPMHASPMHATKHNSMQNHRLLNSEVMHSTGQASDLNVLRHNMTNLRGGGMYKDRNALAAMTPEMKHIAANFVSRHL